MISKLKSLSQYLNHFYQKISEMFGIFTVRVRSTREGNNLTPVCLSTWGGGGGAGYPGHVPVPDRGKAHPVSTDGEVGGGGGVLCPELMENPHQDLDGGPPCQDLEGIPLSPLGPGWGTLPLGPERGYPAVGT